MQAAMTTTCPVQTCTCTISVGTSSTVPMYNLHTSDRPAKTGIGLEWLLLIAVGWSAICLAMRWFSTEDATWPEDDPDCRLGW